MKTTLTFKTLPKTMETDIIIKISKRFHANCSRNRDSDSFGSDSDQNEMLMKEFEQIKQERLEEQRLKVCCLIFGLFHRTLLKTRSRRTSFSKNYSWITLCSATTLWKRSKGLSTNSICRWYEDTVFRNQARSEKQKKKEFVNDNVRSSFHKKFLSKYIYTWDL